MLASAQLSPRRKAALVRRGEAVSATLVPPCCQGSGFCPEAPRAGMCLPIFHRAFTSGPSVASANREPGTRGH